MLQIVNMLSLVDKRPYTCLIIFCVFVPIFADLKCEDLIVRRGQTLKSPPERSVTVSCPVKHCGRPVNVTWCKLTDANTCERINMTENVEIKQDVSHTEDEMISYLTFKRISTDDDGLYRCELKTEGYDLLGNFINISVSDTYPEVEYSYRSNIQSYSNSDKGELVPEWLPYFSICVCVALLILVLIALARLHFYGWRQMLTVTPSKRQEISTHMIPDLPRGSVPSSPVTLTQFSLNDVCSSRASRTQPTPPSLVTTGNHPLANTENESQVSHSALYSVINHKRSEIPAEKQHTEDETAKKSEYAAIKFS